ncbi:MAG TPA: hypothetical protein DGZ24_04065 [Rhodospirillaceae bacterium]|nr:hypothetical protein [Rhodospirillaceae bacterium]|tara:strand:- start:976 stop:1206 length:231 start_codon:yes stop_codon:yes gene_type:complete
MTYLRNYTAEQKATVKRELLKANRYTEQVSQGETPKDSLLKLHDDAFNSAREQRIFLNSTPHQKGCAAYEIADELA